MSRTEREYTFQVEAIEHQQSNTKTCDVTEYCHIWELVLTARPTGQTLTYALVCISEGPSPRSS